ncbi:Disease resistance protein RBA1 [Cardamine amara subsp. amara]|uniref:Disease resistance protein RBA1 n=1 Tax=Cardamine amara subsp. amara TaxID=228776 RepID=A0ABD0ZDC2_CARAN
MLEFIIRKFSLPRIAVSPGKVHQVFLNFRGDQLRHNYVSHLGHALQRNGIKFFIDEDEQKGEDLDNLFVRIEESRIALAIFSTRYSESSWCMNELVKMKELADLKELRVIPIFYKVEAEDVRRPKEDSEFGKNFWKLAQDSSSTGDDIKKWKEALECISQKAGFAVDGKSSESDSIEKIVKALQSILGMKKIKEKGWELQLRI